MKSLKDRDFLFDSLDFLSSMICFLSSLISELKDISSDNYMCRFKETAGAIIRNGKRVDSFVEKWNDDDAKICNMLKGFRQYYAFYCVTLNNSSPSQYRRDANYVIDSLTTSKLELNYRLKKVKESLINNN